MCRAMLILKKNNYSHYMHVMYTWSIKITVLYTSTELVYRSMNKIEFEVFADRANRL